MIRPVLDNEALNHGRWWLRDVRVPAGFFREADPSPLAGHVCTTQCPDGRHTWDVIEAVAQEHWVLDAHDTRDLGDPDGDQTMRQAFRLAFTCITCGRVERRQGEFHDTRDRSTRVDPAPLKAGALRAQMIDPGSRPPFKDRDHSMWLVHDTAGAVIGLICPKFGRRGAVRHEGWLHTWSLGRESVRGASPRAVLRALARAHATGDVQASEVAAASDATRSTCTATTSSSQGGAQ